LKSEMLGIAPLGVVGFHPSKLPANRGRHPLIWALVLGLKETASTFFFMDEGVDSGDILSQKTIEIFEDDDAGDLYQKVTETALVQLEDFVPYLEEGCYDRVLQDHDKANVWCKRGKKDGRIDWRMSARSIHNLVRGLTKPYVGAHFELNDEEIKVW
jgi:methionyl-tRNA formyltransferase